MNRTDLETCCLSKKGAVGEYPFGPDALVIKVMGKMFALIPVTLAEDMPSISLKCDPTLAEMLRQTYPDTVTPGYHLNKRHWNTVIIDGSIPDDEVLEMIDHSYDLVVKGLTRAQRETLQKL